MHIVHQTTLGKSSAAKFKKVYIDIFFDKKNHHIPFAILFSFYRGKKNYTTVPLCAFRIACLVLFFSEEKPISLKHAWLIHFLPPLSPQLTSWLTLSGVWSWQALMELEHDREKGRGEGENKKYHTIDKLDILFAWQSKVNFSNFSNFPPAKKMWVFNQK